MWQQQLSLRMLHICHIWKLGHIHMTQLCHNICLMLTHCNQQCDQEHCYTHVSYYWHITLNKYACHIVYICPSALLLYAMYESPTTAHIIQKQTNCNFYLLYYSHMCASNKYAPQMPCTQITLHASIFKYVNIYVTYKLTTLNVTRSTVNR